MAAVDTNVLVYAHRREPREQEVAFGLVRTLAEDTQTWAIPWPCVYEFFSVVTDPWRSPKARRKEGLTRAGRQPML